MPDDQAVELALGAGHGLQDAFQHLGAQRVVLGDDRQDGHARIHVRQVPQAHAFVFPDGDATVVGRFAEHALGIDLAAVHRQGRARMQLAAARRIRTLGACTPWRAGSSAQAGRGCRSWRGRRRCHRPRPGRSVASRRPARSRTGPGPSRSPSAWPVQVAGIVGHVGQLRGAVVEDVAEQAPQELGLRMAAGAQRGEALWPDRVPEDRAHLVCQLAGAGAVVLGFQVQHLDLAAGLAIDAGAAFLAQRALGNQRGQPSGCLK